MIERQAQELERVKATWAALFKVQEQQLAAMTRGRDELNKVCIYHEKIESDMLAQLAATEKSLRDLYEFFTGNHEDAGLELYGRVNGNALTPSAQRLNELLDHIKAII